MCYGRIGGTGTGLIIRHGHQCSGSDRQFCRRVVDRVVISCRQGVFVDRVISDVLSRCAAKAAAQHRSPIVQLVAAHLIAQVRIGVSVHLVQLIRTHRQRRRVDRQVCRRVADRVVVSCRQRVFVDRVVSDVLAHRATQAACQHCGVVVVDQAAVAVGQCRIGVSIDFALRDGRDQ